MKTIIALLLSLFTLVQAPSNPADPTPPSARIFYTKPLVVESITEYGALSYGDEQADYMQVLTLTTTYESGFTYTLEVPNGDYWLGDILAVVMYNNLTPDTIADDIILIH